MSDNVKNLIEQLKALDNDISIQVFIPSLQKNIKFKQLTTEQLKRILKTSVDTTVFNTLYNSTINTIIAENAIDCNTNKLTIFDKILIVFKLKMECISSDFTFYFNEDEIKQNNLEDTFKTVSVLEHFNSFIEKQINFKDEIFSFNNCTISCSLPTIATENLLDVELNKNIPAEVETEEGLRNVIGITFINEITKYITSIKINETVVDLTILPFNDRIKVIENLPTAIINNVIKYAENYKNSIKDLVVYNFVLDTGANLIKDFPTDASFFNI